MFIFLPPTEILEILNIFCTIGYWVLTIGIGYWVFENRLLLLGIGYWVPFTIGYCYMSTFNSSSQLDRAFHVL
jgi:hypothetical protein